MSDSNLRRELGYTIISRFETTLRSYISNKIELIFNDFKDGIPEGIIEKTNKRSTKNNWETVGEFLENSDFPDLKEIITFKGLFKVYIDDNICSKSDFITMMIELYEIRCKIAHNRGFFTTIDTDDLFEKTRNIINASYDYGDEFLVFLHNLESEPHKYVSSIPESFINSFCVINYSIPNNIPVPDYEYEGGFIGREEDISKILKYIYSDHRVITVTGAGGVGKTALVQKVIQKIQSNEKNQFDGIIWLSAKENRLSVVGIEDIEPTLKNYEELLDTILDVMKFNHTNQSIEKKEIDVNTIFELHNNILIIIDNLETISDERIINFILDAHPNLKILITSRRGLGQVERRYALNQLKENEAITLFRQIARDKKIDSLVKLPNETIKEYVNKVACYPLAIKWIIGNAAIGKNIDTAILNINEENSEIALFCFDQVFNSLSKTTKELICTLSVFEIPPSLGVLQYVTNISPDEFEESIQELILVSLVIPEQNRIEKTTKYKLLSLTQGFVRSELDKKSSLKKEIEERIRTVESTVEEAERAKKQYKFSLYHLGATTDEEKIAALLAQTAFQKYQAGRYIEAFNDYKRASEIAPHFSSVYRNWAVMESNEGHFLEANELMKKASQLNPDDAQIWLTWGNMRRKEDKIKEALGYYEKAKKLSPDDYVILNALGQAKSRLGEYEEAEKLFTKALTSDPKTGSQYLTKHIIINRCSLAENLRKWAENLSKSRNSGSALIKLLLAEEHCDIALEQDAYDIKTNDLHRRILINIAHIYKISDMKLAIKYFNYSLIASPKRFKEIKDSIYSFLQIIKILSSNSLIKELKSFVNKNKVIIRLAQRNDMSSHREIKKIISNFDISSDTKNGKIILVNSSKGFCIIENENSRGETYLGHNNDFIPRIKIIDASFQNLKVSFTPSFNEKSGNSKANFIKIKQ